MMNENNSQQGFRTDFVLVYNKTAETQEEKRQNFEKTLTEKGLVLNTGNECNYQNNTLCFVQIHVPEDVLAQYAEILKIRLPIKEDEFSDLHEHKRENVFSKAWNTFLAFLRMPIDSQIFPIKKHILTAEYSKERSYLFNKDSPNFFTEEVRITVASFILDSAKFGNHDQDKGIKRLLSEGVYEAAYPLHDGLLHENNGSQRVKLLQHWAKIRKGWRYQPIDEIKEYLGVKFALYFTWLGFYTYMLIPAAIVGILCLIYAATNLDTDIVSQDICDLDIDMCPRCDKICDFWKLSEGCLYSKVQHFVDNPATIFFAVFMSVWSVMYLEFWKRYSAGIAHRWGLTGFDLDAEPPRPEYLAKLNKKKESTGEKYKKNFITDELEPAASFLKDKLVNFLFSFGVVLLSISIVIAVVFGVVIYRMSLLTSQVLYQDRVGERFYVLPITAGLINLVSIKTLDFIYRRLAVWLSDLELHRTQTEYNDSLALKIYLFHCVNFYSSIFYIAFLKGKSVGYPQEYNRILGFRQEECNPGGCLMELTVQLAIVMVGNQALNAITEMGQPIVTKWYKTRKDKKAGPKPESLQTAQWLEDYKLEDLNSENLISEYLEMVLQYGFVTLFVAAFPLAPLFALINNIFEMRLDAKKIITFYRRPVPERIKNIGVWFPIMEIIGRISVVTNSFIIAFSSHFIPKLVYVAVSTEHTEKGFLNSTLSVFATADFEPGSAPENPSQNLETCRYLDYRNPPDVADKYDYSLMYWHITAARLAFVVAYQNVVGFVVAAIAWFIPDIPKKVNDRIKREEYWTKEIIIKHETEKTRNRRLIKILSDMRTGKGDKF